MNFYLKYILMSEDINKQLSKISKQYPEFYKEYQKLKSNYDKLLDEKKKSKDQSDLYENKKGEDFYDIIIKIDSIQNLVYGWDISMIDKGKNNYDKYKDKPIIRIGAIGNENKGKSTILKKLSDFNLPTGYSIKTEGLSIKYPEISDHPNLNIVLLDSAGLEAPLLNFDKNSGDIEKDFIEKARDKLLTEVFLQNYIIKNSDLLLLVFGKLTFEEQKLLEKVKRNMKNLNRNESLMVIHNLKEFERKTQVENYINEILLKSSTFKLEKNVEINKENIEKDWCYYYEPNSSPKIFHLIFAREGSEAGDYYNNKAINYILNKTNDITDKQPFDVINSIIDTFCSVSESILEQPLKKEEDLIKEDLKTIKLNNTQKEIKLKRCLIDEIGFSNFLSNGFEPKYDYYITEEEDEENKENSQKKINKFLNINVELPGDYKDTKIQKKKGKYYKYINIRGNKLKNEDVLKKIDKNESSFNNREYGEFNINIKLDDIELESTNAEKKNNNGIYTFRYKLKTNEDAEEF